LAFHLSKKVIKAEELTYLSTNIGYHNLILKVI
jgi:hypothetical protein